MAIVFGSSFGFNAVDIDEAPTAPAGFFKAQTSDGEAVLVLSVPSLNTDGTPFSDGRVGGLFVASEPSPGVNPFENVFTFEGAKAVVGAALYTASLDSESAGQQIELSVAVSPGVAYWAIPFVADQDLPIGE